MPDSTDDKVTVPTILGRIFFETDKRVLLGGKYDNPAQVMSLATGALGAVFNTLICARQNADRRMH